MNTKKGKQYISYTFGDSSSVIRTFKEEVSGCAMDEGTEDFGQSEEKDKLDLEIIQ